MTIDEIVSNFESLDDWEDRYRYLIEIGREMPPLVEDQRTEANKVRGCASQVWLVSETTAEPGSKPTLKLSGDSDAHIVRGLVAVLLAAYAGQSAEEVLATDIRSLFERLKLHEHLSAQRSNGFASMVERIRRDATALLDRSA